MSSQEVHIIAFLYPKQDKLDKFHDLMRKMCKQVHEKENPTALQYLMTEAQNQPQPTFIMIETYKDQDAATTHGQTDHFKELFETFDRDGVMSKDAVIMQSKSVAGFDLSRNLL